MRAGQISCFYQHCPGKRTLPVLGGRDQYKRSFPHAEESLGISGPSLIGSKPLSSNSMAIL